MDSPAFKGFTSRYDHGLSLVLANEVNIAPASLEPIGSRSLRLPVNSIKAVAIWDTGATNTAITPRIVKQLNLLPISMTRVSTAGGLIDTPVYLVDVFLPNFVAIPSLRVTECELVQDTDVLIGMDIITQGDFAVSNYKEKTTFSFRMPSLLEIDLTKPPKQMPITKTLKIGRNDLCPCGSGKKFKNCCMNKKT
jgi:predicted aspartyl protease